MQTLMNENFLNEIEAAAFLGCTIPTLRSNAARRKGPPRIVVSRKPLYREAALLDWMKRREVDPEAARRRVSGE
jgi:hypothetical protein